VCSMLFCQGEVFLGDVCQMPNINLSCPHYVNID